MKRASRSGFTLIEAMVAALLMTLVMAVAVSVIGAGTRVARTTEQTTGSNDSARLAAEVVLRDLRLAGTMQGVFVGQGGVMQVFNPIFTEAGPAGTDALWVIAPRPNALKADCTKVGSAAVVTVASQSGPLTVNCTTSLAGADLLLVTNFKRAALITVTGMAGQTINFAEQGIMNFGPAPEKGGMQRGDLVMPVQLVRYSIVPSPGWPTPPVMLRERGQVGGASFQPIPGGHADVYNDVEDLQVAWGTGVAPNLTFTSGHAALFNAGAVPVAMRFSVVGMGRLPMRDETGGLMNYSPITLEDHVPPVVVDGFRRSVYRRRIELLNNGALNL